MAVGTYTNRAYFSFGVAAQWNGAEWHLADFPLADNVHGPWNLSTVTCLSPIWCMALGRSQGGGATFSELWNGKAWVRKDIQLNTGYLGTYLDSLSCLSSTFCLAAGNASGGFRDAVQTVPESAEWNGRTWRALTLPKLPAGYGFSGMSCTGVLDCAFIAESNYLPFWASGARLLALTGTRWTMLTPQPAPHGYVPEYQSIFCTDSTSCTVLGTETPTIQNGLHDKEIAFFATLSGTSWHTTDLPTFPLGQVGAYVSCPSTEYCIATIPAETYLARPAEILKLNTGSGKVTLMEKVGEADALSAPCETETACSLLVSSCSSCTERLVRITVPAPWNWTFILSALVMCAVLIGAGAEFARRRRVS